MAEPRATHLAFKNHERFQHYKDRSPPWIKLHSGLLSDADFLQLPEAVQAQLMKLWVLASQLGHPLPNNPKLLAGRIGTTKRSYLPELIASGFVIPCEQNASAVLAECLPLTRTRARSRQSSEDREQKHPSPTAREIRTVRTVPDAEYALALRLPTDQHRMALTALCAAVPTSAAWVAECEARLSGMHPPVLTPDQLGDRLVEYVAGKARDGRTNLEVGNFRHFKGFLGNAPEDRPTVPGERSSSASSSARGAMLFADICALATTTQAPGQAANQFIPRAAVEAMGADVLRAYDTIGGASVMLAVSPEKRSYLIHTFTKVLEATHANV